jgi:outer membrane receptor protein involved in Fe transport
VECFYIGGVYNYYYFGYILQYRFVRVSPDQMNPDPDGDGNIDYPDICGYEDLNGDGMDDAKRCRHLNTLNASGNTFNWAVFLQDKWQILPNLTLKAGVRYEQQLLRYADEIQNTVDPVTGDDLGTNAMNLKNLIAPRVGLLYDWTKEGRSKVYANWGRFYESIPMDINTRAFGGETQMQTLYDPVNECNPAMPIADGGVTIVPAHPSTCPAQPPAANPNTSVIGEATLVQPNVKPQYMDEFVMGVEYELLEDLNVGASYQNRQLGRVIEDVSVDGANTYIIANPGEFSSGDEQAMRDEIQRLMDEGNVERAGVLQNRLNQFIKIREFDKPRREYNALQVTAKKRYSKNFFVQGSYTYSRLEGNYPGLYSPDNGQVDPNISSQYDLIELLTNRNGLLPNDRPHIIKLDGYYNFDLREAGNVTTGVRLRAQSGVPVDALGRHYYYGAGESFLIPRGTFGRTDFVTQSDIHVAYGRDIAKDMSLEVYFDIFNIFNLETPYAVDESYTNDSSNPIVGGSKDDLAYLKRVDETDGKETGEQARKNLNFQNDAVRFDSLRGRVGLLLRF